MDAICNRLDAIAARDPEVQRLVASLRPRVSFTQRVKLLRRLYSIFERAKVDNLSTESFKRWAARTTELGEKNVQRAMRAGREVADDVLDAVEERVEAHGQETFVKGLFGLPPDEQYAAVEAHGTDEPAPIPVPTGEVYEPFKGMRLECVDAEEALRALVDERAVYDCAICDWPYGIEYISRSGQRVHGDDKLPVWCLEPLKRLVRPGGCIALWCNAESLPEAAVAVTRAGLAMGFIGTAWHPVAPTGTTTARRTEWVNWRRGRQDLTGVSSGTKGIKILRTDGGTDD